MRLCSHCLHIDVCRYILDPELSSLIDAVVDRVMEFFDTGEDDIKDAFWNGMELLFSRNCTEATWECGFCGKVHHGRPSAWIDDGQSSEDGREPPFPICGKCRTENYAAIHWEDDP